MADDDNFDIDIYGDDVPEDNASAQGAGNELNFDDDYNDVPQTGHNGAQENTAVKEEVPQNVKQEHIKQEDKVMSNSNNPSTPLPQREKQQISSTSGSTQYQQVPPRAERIPQGTKRKGADEADHRPTDPGATTALKITDLHWSTNEEDIRGWANQETCEDELKSITFHEHKVNGRSKGEAYVEMQTAQAATALKSKIESFSQLHSKKYPVYYAPPNANPFRTLPKDAPNRKDYNKNPVSTNQGNQGGSFGRGNFNNRGGFNRGGMGGNFNQGNRNFNNSMGGGAMGGGAMGGMNGGYGSPGGNMGFNPQMGVPGMGGNFGGFNRGGGMGGMNNMRGGMGNRGRGGMGMGGMNPNMPMGMGGMGMGMGMGMMGGGMPGMGMLGGANNFGGGGGHINPAFFGGNQGGGNQGGGGGDMNPHGAKRARGE